jgi:hypothetical protein
VSALFSKSLNAQLRYKSMYLDIAYPVAWRASLRVNIGTRKETQCWKKNRGSNHSLQYCDMKEYLLSLTSVYAMLTRKTSNDRTRACQWCLMIQYSDVCACEIHLGVRNCSFGCEKIFCVIFCRWYFDLFVYSYCLKNAIAYSRWRADGVKIQKNEK